MLLILVKTLSLLITVSVLFATVLIGLEVYRLNRKFIEKFLGPIQRHGRRPVHPTAPPAGEPAAEPAAHHSLRDEALKHAQKLRAALDANSKEALQLTVLELDAFFDGILKAHGYAGADMGERLKEAGLDRVPSIQKLWTSHKIRNRLAHEPAGVAIEEIREALGWYEVVLRDWRLID